MKKHLTLENGLDLKGLPYQHGRKLTVDATHESFVDDPEAVKLLTRPYRRPFVVPDSIA